MCQPICNEKHEGRCEYPETREQVKYSFSDKVKAARQITLAVDDVRHILSPEEINEVLDSLKLVF